jgi:hypothetical protein
LLNVDLHTHTYPGSSCSRISYRDYITWCYQHGIEAVALTNHGNTGDTRKLEAALRADGVLLIRGVEISTDLGDFLVLSPDLDYLDTFRDIQELPDPSSLSPEVAVIWAHPAAGGGRSRSAYRPGIAQLVAGIIDAVEVYNGNWMGDEYVLTAEAIAAELGKARTGGSDAHQVDRLMLCCTEVPDPVRSTEDVVRAIKQGLTVPHRFEAPRKRRGLGIF